MDLIGMSRRDSFIKRMVANGIRVGNREPHPGEMILLHKDSGCSVYLWVWVGSRTFYAWATSKEFGLSPQPWGITNVKCCLWDMRTADAPNALDLLLWEGK